MLPWFMDLTFQVPMQYGSFTASDLASITSHIHYWVLFFLWLHLFILSGVISPLISSSILGTYQPGKFIFQCPILLPFDTAHGVLTARILKWFAILYYSGPHFARTLHHVLSIFGGPTQHGSYLHWVVHVISFISFLWLWFSFCLPSDREGHEVYGCFLMAETNCGGNWVFFWWAGPCSVNL